VDLLAQATALKTSMVPAVDEIADLEYNNPRLSEYSFLVKFNENMALPALGQGLGLGFRVQGLGFRV
jgi:hypothetical protein